MFLITSLEEALKQCLGKYLASTDSGIKIIKTEPRCTLPWDLQHPAPGSHAPSNWLSEPSSVGTKHLEPQQFSLLTADTNTLCAWPKTLGAPGPCVGSNSH